MFRYTLDFFKINGNAVRAYHSADKTCKTPCKSYLIMWAVNRRRSKYEIYFNIGPS